VSESGFNHAQARIWPVGLMDKASASGAGDSRFESWAGHLERAGEAHIPAVWEELFA
jgi:hypothetical protein